MSDQSSNRVEEQFRAVLNRHGYGLHHSVMRKINELHRSGSLPWLLEVSEFPSHLGSDTRIDFIMRPQGTRVFACAECKRVNPSFGRWLFARAPFVRRGMNIQQFLVEKTSQFFAKEGYVMSVDGEADRWQAIDHLAYHVAAEVRTDKKGDEKSDPSTSRNAIDASCGQAFRGMNGVINTLSQSTLHYPDFLMPRLPDGRLDSWFIPVVFTTAELWTVDVDLSDSDLATGELNAKSLGAKQVPWVILQYPVSPSLRHRHAKNDKWYEFAEMLESSFLRSVSIVNTACGIEPFMIGMLDLLPEAIHERIDMP